MIHRTRWQRPISRYEWTTMAVYHALKLGEAILFLTSLGYLSADDWAAKWLFDRD